MNRVLCVGAAVVDFVYYLPSFPAQAQKYRADDAAIVGGGCAANAAVAVARLGGDAMLAAQLGQDSIGDLILDDLGAEGVDISKVSRSEGGRSSYSTVLVDGQGERQIINFRGSGLTFRHDWFESQGDLAAILTDTRRVEPARAAMMAARKRDIPGVVDAEAPVDPEILHPASHVVFSMQGLRDLHPSGSVADAITGLQSRFGGWFAVTDGPNGVHFSDGGGVAHLPAFDIDARDTLGAGDIWHGAFALELANGADEIEAARFANAAAALKCTRLGGRQGCPNRAETLQFLKGEA